MTPEIFRKKMGEYKDTVLRVAFSYCKNKSDAEDIFQDVFLKYYTDPPDIEDESEEKAWLIRVTINQCKNLLKSHYRSKRCDIDEIQESYTMNEAESEIIDTVLSLPEKYRVIIHLYYYEYYTVKEISEITGLKVSTVQTRLQRGRKLLEKKLKEEEAYERSIIQNSYGQGDSKWKA